jgi:hypothetical protein
LRVVTCSQYFKRYGDSEALVAEKREMLTEFMVRC